MEEGRTDIVFVARHPVSALYEAVGIYFDASFTYEKMGNPPRLFAIASTRHFYRIPLVKRPRLEWPHGRSMRRVVKRGGKFTWPGLRKIYEKVLSMSMEEETEEEKLLGYGMYSSSPEHRRAVEDQGIKVTREHYESRGFEVKEMPRNNPGYDLHLFKPSGTEVRKVEVKGTTDIGLRVLVSRKEFGLLRSNETILAMVSGIQVDDEGVAEGGNLVLFEDIKNGLESGEIEANPIQYQLVLG